MFTALLIAQITILSTAPRLSPEEAVRVLKASGSMADRTDAPVVPEAALSMVQQAPLSIMVRSAAGDGPFGAFPQGWRLPPTNPTLTFGIPRRWGGFGGGGLVTSAGFGVHGGRAIEPRATRRATR